MTKKKSTDAGGAGDGAQVNPAGQPGAVTPAPDPVPTPQPTLAPTAAPTPAPLLAKLIKARVLVACEHGKPDDVVEVNAEQADTLAHVLDTDPAAVAYAESLK